MDVSVRLLFSIPILLHPMIKKNKKSHNYLIQNSNILKTSQVIQFSYVFHVITKSQVMTCDGICKMSNRNPIFQMELVKKKDKSSDTKTNRYIIDKYEIIDDEWFQMIQHIIVNKQLIKFLFTFLARLLST